MAGSEEKYLVKLLVSVGDIIAFNKPDEDLQYIGRYFNRQIH